MGEVFKSGEEVGEVHNEHFDNCDLALLFAYILQTAQSIRHEFCYTSWSSACRCRRVKFYFEQTTWYCLRSHLMSRSHLILFQVASPEQITSYRITCSGEEFKHYIFKLNLLWFKSWNRVGHKLRLSDKKWRGCNRKCRAVPETFCVLLTLQRWVLLWTPVYPKSFPSSNYCSTYWRNFLHVEYAAYVRSCFQRQSSTSEVVIRFMDCTASWTGPWQVLSDDD